MAAIALGVVAIGLTVVVNIAVTRRGASGGGGFGSGSAGARVDGGIAFVPVVPPTALVVPAGGASLSGFVVDGAGIPIAGAEVSAEPEHEARAAGGGSGSGSGHGSDSGSGHGSDSGSGSGHGSGGAAPVALAPLTASDGRFSIGGLAAGRYRLRVTGPGLLAAELRYVPVPSETTRVVVARQVAIEGRVIDGTTGVAGAHVGVRGDAIGGAIEVTTDATGAFRVADLPEGRYQVWAWQSALAARAVRVGRLGAGPFGAVELRLETAAIVVGRVVDRDEGTGLVAAVELRPVGDDQAPRYARAGDDGVFRIEGVPNGRWIADVFAPGYTVRAASSRSRQGRARVRARRRRQRRGPRARRRRSSGRRRGRARARRRGIGYGGARGRDLRGGRSRSPAPLFRRTAAPEAAANTVLGMAPGGDPTLLPRGELGVMVGPIPPLPPPGQQASRPATIDLSGGPGAHLAGDPPPLQVAADRASIWTTGADGRYRIRGIPRGKLVVLALAPGFAEARSRSCSARPRPGGRSSRPASTSSSRRARTSPARSSISTACRRSARRSPRNRSSVRRSKASPTPPANIASGR